MELSAVARPASPSPARKAEQVEKPVAQPARSPEKTLETKKTTEAKPPAVINTQGQTTGRLINTTA